MGFVIDLFFIPIKLICVVIGAIFGSIIGTILFLFDIVAEKIFRKKPAASPNGYSSLDDLIRFAEAEGRLIEIDENGDIFVETRDSKARRDQGITGHEAYKKAELYLS